MIISKKKYKAMIEVMEKQRECIRLLEEQNDILTEIIKHKTNFFNNGLRTISDIDFPNSHPVCEPDTRDQWR